MLMGLPNWGETRARAAVEQVGSVKGVLEAVMGRDVGAFKEAKGIGKGLVVGAAEFLESEF